jgi:hypothetical protein
MMEDLPQLGTPTTIMMLASAVGRSSLSQPTAEDSSCRGAQQEHQHGVALVVLDWAWQMVSRRALRRRGRSGHS